MYDFDDKDRKIRLISPLRIAYFVILFSVFLVMSVSMYFILGDKLKFRIIFYSFGVILILISYIILSMHTAYDSERIYINGILQILTVDFCNIISIERKNDNSIRRVPEPTHEWFMTYKNLNDETVKTKKIFMPDEDTNKKVVELLTRIQKKNPDFKYLQTF